MACPDLMLLRHIVEFDPCAVRAVHDALGPEDRTVLAGIQRGQDTVNIRLGIDLRRLLAPGDKHLIGMVMVVPWPYLKSQL